VVRGCLVVRVCLVIQELPGNLGLPCDPGVLFGIIPCDLHHFYLWKAQKPLKNSKWCNFFSAAAYFYTRISKSGVIIILSGLYCTPKGEISAQSSDRTAQMV